MLMNESIAASLVAKLPLSVLCLAFEEVAILMLDCRGDGEEILVRDQFWSDY